MTISYCDICKKVLRGNHYSIELIGYGVNQECAGELSEICPKCARNALKVLKENRIILKRTKNN